MHAKTEPHEVTTAVISTELRVFARRRWPLANDKYRKARLATLLDLTERRIRSFWEGDENAVPRAKETAAIERLIGKRLVAAQELEEAKHEYRDLAQLAASLEALFYGPNADYYRPQVDAIRHALRAEVAGSEGGGRGDAARDNGAGK